MGVLDIADALIFYGLYGVTPARIFRNIASGLVGPAARQDGAGAVALGVCLHFFIAFVVVLACRLASTRLRVITRRPFAAGAAYGLVVYAVMYGVVLPHSGAYHPAHYAWPSVADEIFAHIFLVGIPAALFARAAAAPAPPAA